MDEKTLTLGKWFVWLIWERLDLQIKLQEAKEKLAQLPEFRYVRDLEQQFMALEEKEELQKIDIINWMEASWIEVLTLPELWFEFKIKKNPPSVIIEDENMIPDQFKKEKVTITVDKKAIKDEISKWWIVAWCHLAHWTKLTINKI